MSKEMFMKRSKESWDYGISGVQPLYSCDTDDLFIDSSGARSMPRSGWMALHEWVESFSVVRDG